MADFAHAEIFGPLAMNNTHFHNDHAQIVKNRASGYVPSGNDGYKISMTTLDMIGDGGIFTTINDIKKWDDAYYESSVLSKEFWGVMTEQGILNNGEVICLNIDVKIFQELRKSIAYSIKKIVDNENVVLLK